MTPAAFAPARPGSGTLGDRLIRLGTAVFALGLVLTLFAALVPVLGDEVAAAMDFQESAREQGLTPLFGDQPMRAVRSQGLPMQLLTILYSVALLAGGASVGVGMLLFRPTPPLGELRLDRVRPLLRDPAVDFRLRRADGVPVNCLEGWRAQYRESRGLRSIGRRALLDVGVDAVSGLLATKITDTAFQATAEDSRRLHQSLTFFLEELALRGIPFSELAHRRGDDILTAVKRLSDPPRPRRARTKTRKAA